MKAVWTQADDEQLLRLRDEGGTLESMGKAMRRKPSTIRTRLAIMGLKTEFAPDEGSRLIGPELFDDENDWRKLLRPEVVHELGRRAWRGDV